MTRMGQSISVRTELTAGHDFPGRRMVWYHAGVLRAGVAQW